MTTLPKFSVAHIYNPDNQTKEQLIDSFVVRLPAFQRIYQEIKVEKERFPVQHYVIEGKRGMGKTSFLLRLAYEIENDPGWNTWLLPLVFNEEEYRIRKLYKLWERIAELLEDRDEPLPASSTRWMRCTSATNPTRTTSTTFSSC
jgi:predicted NACHT family NTPase